MTANDGQETQIATPETAGDAPRSPTGEEKSDPEESSWARWMPIKFDRPFVFRIGISGASLIFTSIFLRSSLGWGIFVFFALLIVPMGRARSFVLTFLPYALLWFGFTAIRSLADETTLARTINTAVPNVERWLFGGQLPTNMLQDRFFDRNHLHWYDYLCTFTHWSYFLIPHAVAIRVWYKNPKLFTHYLAAMTMLLGVGLCIYFLIPTNPPWLAPEAIDSSSAPIIYRVMEDVAKQIGGGLYQATYQVIGESNPRAAMPSIHMAITFLIVFPAFHAGRKWGYLALLYSALMGYSLIYLGEHYFVDVVAGMIITTYGWFVAGVWLNDVYPRTKGFMPWVSARNRQRQGEISPQPT